MICLCPRKFALSSFASRHFVMLDVWLQVALSAPKMDAILKSFVNASVLLVVCFVTMTKSHDFREEKRLHSSKSMSNKELKDVALLTDHSYFHKALDNILVPRVVGSASHERVKNFIVSELEKMGWFVELDNFKATTPTHGVLDFSNIISRHDIEPCRQLVLACHYDSKYFSDIEFLGATDSAVPCTMLLHLAKVMSPYLNNQKVGLTLIFFDGEEAFYKWNDYDSIYGSRHLANKWAAQPFARDGLPAREIDRIDVMVLLDLIGVKDQQFLSFFRETQRWHSLLARIESKLKTLSLIPADQPRHFVEKSTLRMIDDDHKPFLRKKVPILHVFPIHFPQVWHTAADNYTCLDFQSIDTMNKIFQVFVYAYMHGSPCNDKLITSIFGKMLTRYSIFEQF